MPEEVYSILACNTLLLLLLFLIVRPMYEMYIIKKIKKDIRYGLTEALNRYHTELKHKMNRELDRLKADIREEIVAGKELERLLKNRNGGSHG